MNARQAAEYRDSITRMKIEAARQRHADWEWEREEAMSLASRTELASATPLQEEAELAWRLLEHVCPDGVLDQWAHALGVARMVIASKRQGGRW